MGVLGNLSLQGLGILCPITLMSPQVRVIWRGVKWFGIKGHGKKGGWWSKGFTQVGDLKRTNQVPS